MWSYQIRKGHVFPQNFTFLNMQSFNQKLFIDYLLGVQVTLGPFKDTEEMKI